MGHEPYAIRFYGPWKCHKSQTLDLMGHESMYSWPWKVRYIKLNKIIRDLSSRNIDGHGHAETCEKTEKRMLL